MGKEQELRFYQFMLAVIFIMSLTLVCILSIRRNNEVKELKSEIVNYKHEVNDYKNIEQKYKKALVLSDYLFDAHRILKTDKTLLLEDYLKVREELNERFEESKSSELIDILSEQYNQ